MSQTVPDSLRTRIQKLLMLSAYNNNEHEAQAAAEKVQALLAEYNLDMSQVTETTDAPDPDTQREKIDMGHDDTEWRRRLMRAIAVNNFCMHWTSWADDIPSHQLVGRHVNVITTKQVYEYLTATVERVNPFVDKRTKARRSWFDGCSERLITRLYQQRYDAERASAATPTQQRGNGTDLVLANVYSTEEELNHDFMYGNPPGTRARENADWAKWREEQRNAPPVPKAMPIKETATQRAKREAQERRSQKQWERQRAKEDAKRDHDAYAMGDNAGNQIGLNRQVAARRTSRLM